MKPRFANVWVNLALPEPLTYKIPDELGEEAKPGFRVLVPLGGNKLVTGVIHSVFSDPPQQAASLKSIHEIPDEYPVFQPYQWPLFEWMLSYYLCRPGDVLAAALPSGLKPNSEQVFIRQAHAQPIEESLSDKAYILWEAFQIQEKLSLKEVQSILNQKRVQPLLKTLMDQGLISMEVEVKNQYKPKTVKMIRLRPEMHDPDQLRKAMDELTKAPKQLEVLMQFLSLSDAFGPKPLPVNSQRLSSSVSNGAPAIKALIEKEILFSEESTVARMASFGSSKEAPFQLSDAQQTALKEIRRGIEAQKPVLFHGVTGSGKTALYFELIAEAIAAGKQVWYLIPEIALTTQLIERVAEQFPGEVTVYHSHLSEAERTEVFLQCLGDKEKQPSIVLGPRSALFLPLERPGLILVDEAHDPGFKQQDPAPRYHGVHMALWLAKHLKIPILLGSATPSLESWHLASTGAYYKVSLTERFGEVQLPQIQIVDLSRIPEEHEDKQFSPELLEKTAQCLLQRKQVIIFQNRRGFSQMLKCLDCREVPQCAHCDISLTFHKSSRELRCHYCGYSIQAPEKCPSCQSQRLVRIGLGTEKVEEQLKHHFPKASVERLDLDTTRRKNAFKEIIGRFACGETDILTGTQMVSKGLDFDRLHLVGVLQADNLLYFPDFRAQERAFQLLMQVSGRAGRRHNRGLVLIQTYSPGHPVIQAVAEDTLVEFYQRELAERQQYVYPPFCRLIYLDLKHKDPNRLEKAALTLKKNLETYTGWRVLGPEAPGPERLRNLFQLRIIIKIPVQTPFAPLRQFLKQHLERITAEKSPPRITINVDPI